MRLRSRFVLASLATLVVACGGILSLSRELQRARRSGVELGGSPGDVVVASVRQAGAPGLAPGDRILTIEGRPVTDVGEVEAALSSGPGPRRILVSRSGQRVEVGFRPAPVELDWRYLFLALVGALTLGIGLATLRRAPRERGVPLFFWTSASVAAILLLSPGERYDVTGRLLFAIEELSRALAPPLLVHLALTAPGRPRPVRQAAWLYLPASLIVAAELDLYLLAGRHLPVHPLRAMVALDQAFYLHCGCAALAAVALWVRRSRVATGEEARRLRWLLAGTAGGLLPVLFLGGFPWLFGADWAFVRVLSIPFLALLPLGLGAAMARFRLQEVDRALAQVAGGAVTLLAALLVFGSVNAILMQLLPALSAPPRHLAAFTAGFGMTFALTPIRRRLTDRIQRLQKLAGEKERKALGDFARELAIHGAPDELATSLASRIEATLPRLAVGVYLAGESGELVRVGRRPDLPPEIAREAAFGPSLVVGGTSWELFPMESRGRLHGLLAVRGPDGLPPDAEDRGLLQTLATTAAVAVDNARLYQELSRETERARSMAEFNEQVLESSGTGIAVIDDRGRILAANSLFAALSGRSRDELCGLPLDGTFAAASPGPDGLVVWMPPGQSAPRTLEIRREPMAGSPLATVLVVLDRTEREALRQELSARERLATVGLVASSVAHEVNTPLAGISAYAQMLLEETPEGSPGRELLSKIEAQTFRASAIVRDVLEMARGQALERRPVDLSAVVRASLESLAPRLEASRVAVEVEAGSGPSVVAGEAIRLERAVVNVLDNARAAAPGGRLRIGLCREGKTVWLRVTDDGQGIRPEDRARVLEPLFSTKGRAGTGLGLALAAEVVRAHGGTITVEAAPERGTTVTLGFPAAD